MQHQADPICGAQLLRKQHLCNSLLHLQKQRSAAQVRGGVSWRG
jgi:hypothetical protein